MRFVLTTDPGLEDLVAEEVADRLPTASLDQGAISLPGNVSVESDCAEQLLALATIQHVIEVRADGGATTLDDIRTAAAALELPELTEATSFRVNSLCSGTHDFTRREIEGAVGAAIQRRYRTRVDLMRPEVTVRFDLHGDRFVAGLQRTDRQLDKRIRRVKALRTSLRPTTAAAMVRLAGAQRGAGSLIDPMCGSGTIPIEAKRVNPQLDVVACDWDRATVEVARGTIANHSLAIDVQVRDARCLRRAYGRSFDFIVTDPPYGVRLATRTGITTLYRALLPAFEEALAANGRIVMAVLKYRTLLGVLEESDLRVCSDRVVGTGDLRPRLVVLGRR